MENLSSPSKGLAFRVLQEVDFENRFIGASLHLRAGVRVESLYCLEEVFMLLKKTHPRIDLPKLKTWISDVIKDAELAHGIEQIITSDTSELHKMLAARDMISQRIIQCRKCTRVPENNTG